MNDVIVLGAGPAGLAAALELAEKGLEVAVVEQQQHTGGNATSFEFGGVYVDLGSHRLHPASHPEVLERIRKTLGDDLLTRPRHGRIRLMGRWIHFPLRPVDLALRMHPKFAMGVGLDMLGKVLPASNRSGDNPSFATILRQGLGNTICNEFYFPYARKIWGIDPEEISPIQAYKRVSAGSLGKMIKRLLPGNNASGGANTKGIFYYPRYGFGQISKALHEAAEAAGATFYLGHSVDNIALDNSNPEIRISSGGKTSTLSARQVYSTIPINILARLIQPGAPESVLAAAGALRFRSMVLAYVQLNTGRFTEFDAHYFPGEDIPFTRLSEPRNYSDRREPEGRTVLCAEIPCFLNDEIWSSSDQELATLVSTGLEQADIPIQAEITAVKSVRLPFAYPLFTRGYEQHFKTLDQWVNTLDGILSFGRQGLYVHDNTHHAIYMAQAAARCLRPEGSIDKQSWQKERKIFESHVVED